MPSRVVQSTVARPLLDPGQLIVKDPSEPPISLPDDVYRTCDADVLLAKPVRTPKPWYTPTAMRAKVQGSVVLFGIVDRNGAVTAVRVIDSLDPGLDAEAQKAFEQWHFQPATRKGEPVALAINVEMTFALR